jgi:hypothetical protein
MATAAYKWLVLCSFWMLTSFKREERRAQSEERRVQNEERRTESAERNSSFPALRSPLFSLHSPFSVLRPSPFSSHPLYVSVTEINHNAAEKSLEISIKVFPDDLEQILEKNNKAQLDILAEKDKSRFDQYIPSYFDKNLLLTVDGKQVKLSYVGFEIEKESAYCYFEVKNIASVKKIDVTNSILYDFNDTEMNIMHVTVGGSRKSGKVNYPEKAANFSF